MREGEAGGIQGQPTIGWRKGVGGVTDPFSGIFTSLQSTVEQGITDVIPVALSILALVLGVRYAVRLLKSVAGR